MAWIEVNCAIETVNLARRDWDGGDRSEPAPIIYVTIHLQGLPSEQTLELSFSSVDTLRKLAEALTEIGRDPFEHGRDWRARREA